MYFISSALHDAYPDPDGNYRGFVPKSPVFHSKRKSKRPDQVSNLDTMPALGPEDEADQHALPSQEQQSVSRLQPLSGPLSQHHPLAGTVFPSLVPVKQTSPQLVRRFPGPAGLMSELSLGLCKAAITDENMKKKSEQEEDGMECEGVVHCVVWEKALQELKLVNKDSLVEKFNTNWIKNMSSDRKMPFFLCKVRRLDLTSIDPTVLLVDRVGEVVGSMHRDVVELFGKEVTVGCALVLKSLTVIVMSGKKYVNITLNNLVSIYTKASV